MKSSLVTPATAAKVAPANYALGELRQRAVTDVQHLSRYVAGSAGGEEQRHPGDLGGNRRRRAGQTFVAGLRTASGGDGVDGDTASAEDRRLTRDPTREGSLDGGLGASRAGVLRHDADDRPTGAEVIAHRLECQHGRQQ